MVRKMNETRAGKYGRNLSALIGYVIKTIPRSQRQDYRTRFIAELKEYSFEPRRNGQPRNSGCVHELEDIDEIDMRIPEDLARQIKEGIHLMYQKQTAAKVMSSLLRCLEVQ
jgi:hypothetical protein